MRNGWSITSVGSIGSSSSESSSCAACRVIPRHYKIGRVRNDGGLRWDRVRLLLARLSACTLRLARDLLWLGRKSEEEKTPLFTLIIYGNIAATFGAKTRQNRAKWKRGYPVFSIRYHIWTVPSITMLCSVVINLLEFRSAGRTASVRSHQPELDRAANLFPRHTRSFICGANRS